MSNSAMRLAIADIRHHIINETDLSWSGNSISDVWNVAPNSLISKENTRLNKELGISNINYFKNKNRWKLK